MPANMNITKLSKWGAPRSKLLGLPSVIFHGGLGPGDSRGHTNGRPKWLLHELKEIGQIIQKALQKNAPAHELCLLGVEELERREVFNAGRGAKLQADGKARLTAAVMDGSAQRMAAVFNVQKLIHPSKVAYSLLKEKDRCLSSQEANDYAFAHGFTIESPETDYRIEEWKQKKEGLSGTVGCVAFDSDRKSFAATSTGGRGMERPGRVSDSGTPAGNFANRFGAVSCTGVGEDILDVSLASAIVTRLEDGMNIQEAVSRTFFRHPKRQFGMIGLDSSGNAIVHANSGTLSFGLVTPNLVYVGLDPEDWRKLLK